MTSIERRAARYARRKENRERKRQQGIGAHDDFGLIADVDNLYESFERCKLGVSWKESVQRYESNALNNIIETRRKLLAGESVNHGFVEFDLRERGKVRHIKSIHISERVVQKCLCDHVLVPILGSPLIYDNGATQKNKGVHFSIRRLVTHLSRFYRKNGFSNEGYVLTIDFTRFFDSVRHDILFKLQRQYIHDERVMALVQNFVRVFGPNKSLGLGSQVSQISAVFYPSKLDHFIKEQLRIKGYGRYMDDLYLIHESKEYLEHCLVEIKRVCGTLDITVNDRKTKITALRDGMIFLKGKYILQDSGKVLRLPGKDSIKRMRRKMGKFRKLLRQKKMKYTDVYTAYQSWKSGYMKRFSAYRKVQRMDELYRNYFIKNHG